jgi:hypothetical protein
MALSEDGKTLFLGGNFHSFGPRTGSLVPIDAASGKALPAYPKADGTIEAIAPDGKGGFYVGGSFRRIGNAARRGLAHILADGSVDASFQASVDGNVAAIAISGDRVFVGGAFSSLGGQPRPLAGAVDAATGAVTSWAPEDVLRPGPVRHWRWREPPCSSGASIACTCSIWPPAPSKPGSPARFRRSRHRDQRSSRAGSSGTSRRPIDPAPGWWPWMSTPFRSPTGT